MRPVMKLTADDYIMTAMSLLLLCIFFLLGYLFGNEQVLKDLRKRNYVQIEIKDKHGEPIPGYIGCECRMSGRKDRPGIYFWTTQNMKGQFDEIREGKAIPTDRGN